MIQTFAVDFDHHAEKNGRVDFDSFVAKIASRFAKPPHVVRDPIFSYSHAGAGRLIELATIDITRPAIVYLSNIVMHSFVLVAGDCDLPDVKHVRRYSSLDELRESPSVTGYYSSLGEPLLSHGDDSTLVISDLATFQDDEGTVPPNLFRIIQKVRDAYICNIVDWSEYFAHCDSLGDEPYFLPSSTKADLATCAIKYDECSLTDFLLDEDTQFATLGDNHMDDEIAISYRWQFWRCPDHRMAFIR